MTKVTVLGGGHGHAGHSGLHIGPFKNGKGALVDCGWSVGQRVSQTLLGELDYSTHDIKQDKISHMFLTHHHGDHVGGVPFLLYAASRLNSTLDWKVYSPEAPNLLYQTLMSGWVKYINLTGTVTSHQVGEDGIVRSTIMRFLKNGQPTLEDLAQAEQPSGAPIATINDGEGVIYVRSTPIEHGHGDDRLPTRAFRFDREAYKVDNTAMQELKLTPGRWIAELLMPAFKRGDTTIEVNGTQVELARLVRKEARSLAYITDTRSPVGDYFSRLVAFARGVDVLLTEANWTTDMARHSANHMSAADAKALAEAAFDPTKKYTNQPRLLLMHMAPQTVEDSVTKEAASDKYQVQLAKTGAVHEW